MKLSEIQSEASRLCGRIPEEKRFAFQQRLTCLCRARWSEVRGNEPFDRVARAIWMIDPPVSDLFLDLYACGDSHLAEALAGLSPSQGLELVALAAIGEGSEEEARIAHEPMMLLDSSKAGIHYAEKIASFLRGGIPFQMRHPHSSRPPLWKGLALIAESMKRCDASAAVTAMGLLSGRPGNLEDELEHLRERLEAIGMRFIGVEDDHIRYSFHGRERKPLSKRQAAEILGEIRATWVS